MSTGDSSGSSARGCPGAYYRVQYIGNDSDRNRQGDAHKKFQNPQNTPLKQKGSRTEECLTLPHQNTLKKSNGLWHKMIAQNIAHGHCPCPKGRSSKPTLPCTDLCPNCFAIAGQFCADSTQKMSKDWLLQTASVH